MIQPMKNALAYCLKLKIAHKTPYNIVPHEYNHFCCSGPFLLHVNVPSAAESVDEKRSSLLLKFENCRKKFYDIMLQG
jgi:hypothetical protein